MKRLPQKILPIPNADKKWHEKWDEGRDLLNIPHPFRLCTLGPPNSGKSTAVKNILLRINPYFEKIYLCHCDIEGSQEYDDIKLTKLKEIPEPSFWDGQVKTLVILDDLEFKDMKKQQRACLDRLYGYCSTHKNISVILCCQNFTNIPPIVRRCTNMFVLWRINDYRALKDIGKKCGIRPKRFDELMEKYIVNIHDSLWCDLTSKSPAKIRINGYQIP